MKRLIALIAVACLCFAGCASGAGDTASNSNDTSDTTSISTTVADVSEILPSVNENEEEDSKAENEADNNQETTTSTETEPELDTVSMEEKTYNVFMFKQDDEWWLKFIFTVKGKPSIAGSSLRIEVIDSICDYKFFNFVEYNDKIVLSPTLTPDRNDGDGGIFGFGGEYITVSCDGDRTSEKLRFLYSGKEKYFTVLWNEDGTIEVSCSEGPDQVFVETAE